MDLPILTLVDLPQLQVNVLYNFQLLATGRSGIYLLTLLRHLKNMSESAQLSVKVLCVIVFLEYM